MKNIIKKLSIMIVLVFSIMWIDVIKVQASEFDNYLKKSISYHLENVDSEFKFIYEGNIDSAMKMVNESSKCDGYTFLNAKYCKLTQYGDQFTAKITYRMDKSQNDYVVNMLKDEINKNINDSMTIYDKVNFVNKYLIDKLEYDNDMQSYDPYTALTTGKTVCQGYAMTAAKMYDLLGIKNEIVIGKVDGEGHGWNRVQIGQNWYNIDTTNCDALKSDDILFLKSDKYFREYGFNWDDNSVTAPAYYDYDEVSHDNDDNILKPQNNNLQCNKWYSKNNVWYFKDLKGNNAIGWLYDSGKWYYLDQFGRMKTGWQKYNNKWYYFNNSGQMQTGQKLIGKKQYYFNQIGQLVY